MISWYTIPGKHNLENKFKKSSDDIKVSQRNTHKWLDLAHYTS